MRWEGSRPGRSRRRGALATAFLLSCMLTGMLWLSACSKTDRPVAGSAAIAKPRDPLRAAIPGLTSEPGESVCKDVGPAPESLPGAESIVYRTASNRPLRLFVFRPEKPSATPLRAVLFYFGGGWRSGSVTSFADQAQAFAANGYVAVLADYRVSCRDGTTPLAAVSDARAAYKWLRKHAGELGVDPTQIALSGGAAGGQLALVTAMEARPENKPTALVLFNPVVDLVTSARWYLKPLARQISPTTLSAEGLPPTLILHGEADRRVPIDTVRAFCNKAHDAGAVCAVRGYPGEDHGFYHRRTVLPVKTAAGGAVAQHDQALRDVRQVNEVGGGEPGADVSPFDDTTARALAFLRYPSSPM